MIRFIFTPLEMPEGAPRLPQTGANFHGDFPIPRIGEIVTFTDDDGHDCTARVADICHRYVTHVDDTLHYSHPSHTTQAHSVTVLLK